MYKIMPKSFFIMLSAVTGILFLMPARALSGFGASGWTILRKAQSAQFNSIAVSSLLGNDFTGFLYNPAVLGAGDCREISLISEMGPADDKFGGLLYGEPVKKGMISFGYVYHDAGIAELNWIENNQLMTRNVRAETNMLGIISYGRRLLDNLFAGISAKFVSSELAQMSRANAYGGDLGFLYLPLKNLSFSLALQNFGKSTKFIYKENPLPLAMYLGSGYLLKLNDTYMLYTAGATYLEREEKTIPEAGIELGYGFISLSAGYRFVVEDLNLHIGLKILVNDMIFGYAYVQGIYLDSSHRLSVSYKIGSRKNKNVQKAKIRKRLVKKSSKKPRKTLKKRTIKTIRRP